MTVPELRFPEFWNAGEWEEKQLEFICNMQAGTFVSASDIFERYGEDLYPCYGGNGLRGYTKTYTHSGEYPLIGRQGALCGNVNLGIGKFHATEHAVVTTPKDNIDVNWLFYELNFLNLNRYATGQAQPGLSVKVLEKISIVVPKEEKEQQKIADCLSSIGDRITAETQKLDTLKAHKKGLMQQLFPAEGKTLLKRRFPEFRNLREWKEKKLRDVIIKSFYGTSSPTSDTGKYPVLRMGDMSNGKLDFSNLVYIDLDDSDFEKFRLKKGDILLNRTNSYDLVGKISVFESEIKCLTASYIVAYRLDKTKLNPNFCNNILNTFIYQEKIRTLATKSVSQANINPTIFKEEVVLFLPELGEQQKIADCFASLDELIAAQTQKIDTLKTHKKGLMQQLFPTLDEVKR